MTRHLVTSALPYINGVKHIGNLIGSMLPADVYARYLRQKGEEVLYVCATDDHGTPAELGALKAGLTVEEYCDRQHVLQAEVYAKFHLSFDVFGRTSRPQNRELTQHFARKLEENGLIEERAIRQFYSNTDQRFLPDRYIEGTCPFCASPHARGDQCENCTKVLNPEDLINPRSAISGSTDVELRETRHLFLLQSKLESRVRAWVESNESWPALVKSIALKWLNEGLQDRGITRDLHWGVPVPKPGYETKVFYVWFDAPIGYIAATHEWADAKPGRDWKSWWYGDAAKDVDYTQFMAKDNVPFHTVSFPATLLGSNEPWKMADYIKGFNWLTYYGGKFSTSRGVGIFTADAIEILPVDYWRYALLFRAPESSDSSFTWEDMQGLVNKDLCDVLGNLVNRTLQFSAKRFGAELPPAGPWTALEEAAAAKAEGFIKSFHAHLSQKEFRKAMADLRALWVEGNQYITEAAPWTVIKTDETRAKAVINFAAQFIRLIALVSHPVIPESAERIAALVGETIDPRRPLKAAAEELRALPDGRALPEPKILFTKIEDEAVAAYAERFKAPA